MTEADWLTSVELPAMLQFLRNEGSDRKLRLFAVWCCSTIRHLLVPEALDLLTFAERLADGMVGEQERKQARKQAFGLGWISDRTTAHRRGPAKSAVCNVLARMAWDAAETASRISIGLRGIESDLARGWVWGSEEGKANHRIETSEALRDIFGNPFLPVAIDPRWLTSSVVDLARLIYDERAFDRLPILADALMDAGCDNDDILNHCRGTGPHVRGCWVVDLLMGRE